MMFSNEGFKRLLNMIIMNKSIYTKKIIYTIRFKMIYFIGEINKFTKILTNIYFIFMNHLIFSPPNLLSLVYQQ